MKLSNKRIQEMKQQSQRSILWDYKDEISKLRNENVSFRAIKEWLSEQKVDTCIENIRQFHMRNLDQKTFKQQLNTSTEDDSIFSDLK